MSNSWEPHLERWTAAGLIDAGTAAQIRAWQQRQTQSEGLRWPIWMALAFGALLLCAGVLLFVSAHWDSLSSAERMSLVVLMVAVFHTGGAFAAGRFSGLATVLHTLGTVSLGAGIALAGQIYNLAEHWPTAVLLWAIGAAAAWVLLRDWPPAALVAILVPWWLAGEWSLRAAADRTVYWAPIWAGVCALCLTYLSARTGDKDSPLRQALGWIGGIALLPAATAAAAAQWSAVPSGGVQVIGWTVALLLPLSISRVLRRQGASWNAVAIVWALLLTAANGGHGDRIVVYVWCAVGAAGLTAWGIHESRPERINLGMAGFALTVFGFYFSNVMDKLGRSASLMVLGALFLGGGWLLERTRRRLLSQMRSEAV